MSLQISAQWTDNTKVNTVINDSIGEQIYPIISLNSQTGNHYISWQSNFGGYQFDLFLNMIDNEGYILWENEGLLISNQTTEQSLTSYGLINDNDNCAVLVNPDMRGGFDNLFAYRISPDKDFLWGDDGLQLSSNTDTNISIYSPVVALDHEDNYLFEWTWDSLDAKRVIVLQKVDKNMTLIWGEPIVLQNDTMLYKAERNSIIVKPDNGFYVVFGANKIESAGQGYSNLFVQNFDKDGNHIWDQPIALEKDHSFDPGFFFNINAHYQKDGGVIIVWQSASEFLVPSIKMQHIDSAGELHCGQFGVVVEDTDNLLGMLESVYDLVNDVTYVFYQSRYLEVSTYYQCLKGQRISSDGDLLWGDTAFSANTYSTNEYYPTALTMHPDNSILVTYIESFTQYKHTDRAYTADEIKAFRLAGDAQYIWSPDRIIVSDTLDRKKDFQITSYIEGQWILVWSENRRNPLTQDNVDGIYAQNINENGSIGPMHILEHPSSKKNKLRIWPNPSSTTTSISYELDKAGKTNYYIYDIQGKKVKSTQITDCKAGTNTISFECNNMKPGIYSVFLTSGNQRYSSSFVIQ